MADRAGFKEGLLTYSYLLLYIALSSGQIFFNKVPLNIRSRLMFRKSAEIHEP